MKLALLGGVTIVIGLALTETGLLAIGALWVLLGPLMRAYGRKLGELKTTSGQTAIDGRSFAIGTLLWLLLGVPSLLVGLLKLGISPEHAGWRWLPIVIGGLALGIGVLGGLMYLLGSGVAAVAKRSPQPTVPATNPAVMDTHRDEPIARQGGADPAREVSTRLAELDRLYRAGQITHEEHRAQRERILGSL